MSPFMKSDRGKNRDALTAQDIARIENGLSDMSRSHRIAWSKEPGDDLSLVVRLRGRMTVDGVAYTARLVGPVPGADAKHRIVPQLSLLDRTPVPVEFHGVPVFRYTLVLESHSSACVARLYDAALSQSALAGLNALH